MNLILEQQVDAVVRAGVFPSREAAQHEALQTLFAVRPQLRLEAALELVRSGEVSIARAAEIAGVNFEIFRNMMRDRSIDEIIEGELASEMDERINAFFGEATT